MLKLQKTILISALALTGMTSTTAFAEVTANAAATSNYLWRGQEQTGGDAAVSGGIDYANESGFYAGTWASNASWADEMTYELDLYAGFGGAINESVSYDVGYIYYAYPDAASGADADFSEVYGSISVQGFTFGAAVLATSAANGAILAMTLSEPQKDTAIKTLKLDGEIRAIEIALTLSRS